MRTQAGRLIWLTGFVTVVVSGIAPTVRAGPLEQLVQVLWNEAKPERLALRYDNAGGGLIVSEDGGRTFALVCAAAFGTSDFRTSSAMLDEEGRIWLGSFDGLVHDDGTGCDWTREPRFGSIWTTDLVSHPSQPDVQFAVTGAAEPMKNGIYRSDGAGAFAPFGAFDDAQVMRLRVAHRGAGLRFYESALRGTRRSDLGDDSALVPNYQIRVSDDGAEHWTEHTFPSTLGSMRLEAVDPTNADRIIVSVATELSTRLLVSSDAGASFSPYLELAALGGIAITPEGRVYIGDAGSLTGARPTRGLWLADNLGEPARLLTDAYAVQCLGYRASDATLFVCERYAFGTADLETGKLSLRFSLTKLERLAACPGRDLGAICRPALVDGYCSTSHFPCAPACDAYGVDLSDLYAAGASDPSLAACFDRHDPGWRPAVSDAGTSAVDAGHERAADAGSAQRESSGCNIAPPGSAGRLWGPLLWAGMCIVHYRRRRKPRHGH